MGNDRESLHHKNRAGRKKREEAVSNYRATTWLICSEGHTECNYFEGLIKHLKETSSSKVVLEPHPLGKSTGLVVNAAEDFYAYSDNIHSQKRIPYAKTIFVFDKDSFSASNFNNAIQMGGQKPDSVVAWSNESFELWLRLHFEYIDSAQTRYQHNDWLTEKFREKGVFAKQQNYEKKGKNLKNIFDIIKTCGGCYKFAIDNAKRLEKAMCISSPAKADPATMVHKAVEDLINAMK